ncbi:MAG: pyrimidine/purine nucleoside phosphorylase [Nitrospirae bacterium]|nr:pyrimidine/purine nucleoside phosphorylase [Candidatus Manganitrophaceae bacterium]
MSEFKNITVKKAANIFFDGKVTSRTVFFPDGSRKTLGIMQPGEFEFKIGDSEIMEILSGNLEVLLEGEKGWKPIKGGEQFTVAAHTTFKLKVYSLTDYCCSFIKS